MTAPKQTATATTVGTPTRPGSGQLIATGASLVALLASLLQFGCPGSVDFDTLSNACEQPLFDVPGLDTFCSGNLGTGTFYEVDYGLAESVEFTGAVARSNDLLAIAGNLYELATNRNCTNVYLTIDLARVEADGSLTRLGAHRSSTSFVQTTDGAESCPDETIDQTILPLDITFLTSDPPVVAAAYHTGGILGVRFSSDGTVQGELHFGAGSILPTARYCVFGACILGEGERCYSDLDCGPWAHCQDDECVDLPSCDDGCESQLACDETSTQCTTQCSDDLDCPRPLSCDGGMCGLGCNSAADCGDDSCLEGYCVQSCTNDSGCSQPEVCLSSGSDGSVCGSSNAQTACADHGECASGVALALTAVGARPFLLNTPALVVASETGIKIGLTDLLGDPIIFRTPFDLEVGAQIVSDVEYDAANDLVLAAFPLGVLAIFDIRGAENAGLDVLSSSAALADYVHVEAVDLNQSQPLDSLRLLGGFDDASDLLVTFEGGLTGAAGQTNDYPDTNARLWRLTRSDSPLELLSIIDLGNTIFADAAWVEGASTPLLAFAINRSDGTTDLQIFDVADVTEPRLLSTETLPATAGSIIGSWPNLIGDELYLSGVAGVAPYRLSLAGGLQ